MRDDARRHLDGHEADDQRERESEPAPVGVIAYAVEVSCMLVGHRLPTIRPSRARHGRAPGAAPPCRRAQYPERPAGAGVELVVEPPGATAAAELTVAALQVPTS